MANSPLRNEEDILATLQCLRLEEVLLTEKKEKFESMLNQLEIKGKEELKKLKQKVDSLNSEVLELREKCNKLRVWIKESLTPECSQATPPE